LIAPSITESLFGNTVTIPTAEMSTTPTLPNGWTFAQLATWGNQNPGKLAPGMPQPNTTSPISTHQINANQIAFDGLLLTSFSDLSAGTNTLAGQLLGQGMTNGLMTAGGYPITVAQQNAAYWSLSAATTPSSALKTIAEIAVIAALAYVAAPYVASALSGTVSTSAGTMAATGSGLDDGSVDMWMVNGTGQSMAADGTLIPPEAIDPGATATVGESIAPPSTTLSTTTALTPSLDSSLAADGYAFDPVTEIELQQTLPGLDSGITSVIQTIPADATIATPVASSLTSTAAQSAASSAAQSFLPTTASGVASAITAAAGAAKALTGGGAPTLTNPNGTPILNPYGSNSSATIAQTGLTGTAIGAIVVLGAFLLLSKRKQ